MFWPATCTESSSCGAWANQYPDAVVGLVLVDASHPDQWLHIPMSMRRALPGFANRVVAVLVGLGTLRIWDPLTPQIALGLPEHQYAEMRAIIALTPHILDWRSDTCGMG